MSFLEIALFIILAAIGGVAFTFFFLRDRARANLGSGGAGPDHLANEVRAIGSQIENALAQQRLQGETQRQVLGQKLDGVRQTVDSQQAQVQVLQSEMRHESQRRDAEIAEIHDRLASIQTGNVLAPPPSLALEAHEPEPAVEFEDVYDAPPAQPEPSPVNEAPAPVLEVATPEPTPQPQAPPEESLFSEFTFDDVSFEDVAPEPVAPPALEDADLSSAAPSSFEDVAFEAPSAPATESAPPAPSVFEDAAPFLPTPHGDGSPTDDLFESWSPGASTTQVSPQRTPSPTATLKAEASSIDTLEVEATSGVSTPPDGLAWIARPSEEHAEPVVADDLIFLPSTAPLAEDTFVEPSLDELDDIEAGLEAFLPSPQPALEDAPLDPVLEDEPSPEPVSTPLVPVSEPEAFVAPEGADDLTVITSIDEDVQRLLYLAGVTSLDQIAQWGRTSARRYSAEVSVSEETIMTQWVFEAQAALFNRYATQMGQ